MKRIVLMALAALLSSAWVRAAETGIVCIKKTSAMPSKISEPLSAGAGASTGRTVLMQIDKLQKQKVSPETTAVFTHLPLNTKHLVKIYDGEGKKRLASFPFTFESYKSTTLCIWQNDLYNTWTIDASGPSCTCPAQ